jgi:hypothetical protein
MKNFMTIALLAAGAGVSSVALAAPYEVYATKAECKVAAKAASAAGEIVGDCRFVDGGWTYEPEACNDGQCWPD